MSALDAFREAMQKAGLVPPADVVADGKLHRCATKNGKLNGAYILHLDGRPAGGFLNWQTGEGWQPWSYTNGHDRREHRPQAHARVLPNEAATEYSGTLKKKRPIESKRSQWLELWRETEPLPGTYGMLHLERRGVSYEGDALRWHQRCPFGKVRVGCMVALVRNIVTNEPQAIHRTAIDRQGRKLSHLGSNGRLSLGPTGGGAIKLTGDADVERVLAIGEGIETTLSIRRLPDLERMPVWAVLNANGISSFPALPGIESVWIAADNDKSGTGQKVAQTLAQRLGAAGIETVIIIPQTVGNDLNDEAMANV